MDPNSTSTQDRWFHPSRQVALLWACFLVRGMFYCLGVPLWEGFDEYVHFAYVQNATDPHAPASREIERSIELVPMSRVLRFEPPAHETFESYWQLPAQERSNRQRELASLPRSLRAQSSRVLVRSEAQQPPLSYWMMAPLERALAGASLPARVLALRILNLLLASVAVPAAWIAARRLFGAQAGRVALAAAALVVLMPETMFDVARVANSGLPIALYSALAVLCLDLMDGKRAAALWIGAVLGLGLITKAMFLTAVPAVVAILAWAVWRRSVTLRSALGAIGIAAALSGWLYIRNLVQTHSLSGLMQDAALSRMPLLERLGRLPDVNWLQALDSTFLSHIWIGDWSFLQLRAWIYHSFAILAAVALVGLAVAWIRPLIARTRLFVPTALYLCFCAGLVYHVLITFLANGVSSSGGWYLCAIVVPEAILAAAGLSALAPPKLRHHAVGGVAAAFALTDLYGLLFVALPYYTGMIGHKPNGGLEAFHLSRLAEVGLGEFLRRIAANKPDFVGPFVVGVAGCAYVAATIVPAVLVLASRRAPAPRVSL